MRYILSSALALATFLASPVFAKEQIVRFHVGGLTCPSCSFIVGNSLKSVESTVIDEFVESDDATQGVYTVRFDDEVATVDDLLTAVKKNGYPIELLADTASGKGS
tara:strand:- start:6327 stop:6644 length:318 start_codon:yes stop_codon:yes gene_type:complete